MTQSVGRGDRRSLCCACVIRCRTDRYNTLHTAGTPHILIDFDSPLKWMPSDIPRFLYETSRKELFLPLVKSQFWHQANISRQIKPPQVFETSGRSTPVFPFLPCSCFHSTSYASGACFSVRYTAFEKFMHCDGLICYWRRQLILSGYDVRHQQRPCFALFLCRSLLHPLSFS